MSIMRGSLLMVRVPDGKDPKHGWNNKIDNFDLGFADAPSREYTTFYNERRVRGSHDNKELIVLEHPFVATYACLGRGVTKAVFDATSKEEAMKAAAAFITDKKAKDVAARTIAQLPWIDNPAADLNPILLGVEDKKPVLETLRSLMWKGRG